MTFVQLMPFGICRLILQVVVKMLGAEKAMLEERMATSLTGEAETFSGINVFWEEYRKTVNVIFTETPVSEALHSVEPQRGSFLSLCKDSTM